MEGEGEWEKMGRRVRDGGRGMERDSERDIFGEKNKEIDRYR
jgi:hypothetical protein